MIIMIQGTDLFSPLSVIETMNNFPKDVNNSLGGVIREEKIFT